MVLFSHCETHFIYLNLNYFTESMLFLALVYGEHAQLEKCQELELSLQAWNYVSAEFKAFVWYSLHDWGTVLGSGELFSKWQKRARGCTVNKRTVSVPVG